MLDKGKLTEAYKQALKDAGLKENELAPLMGRDAVSLNQSFTRYNKIVNLEFMQEVADALNTDLERIILPGLTEAGKYINSGNFDQSSARGSNVSGFARDPFQHTLNKSSDAELQNKYNECQEKVISLTEEKVNLKDQINDLKDEIRRLKGDK